MTRVERLILETILEYFLDGKDLSLLMEDIQDNPEDYPYTEKAINQFLDKYQKH